MASEMPYRGSQNIIGAQMLVLGGFVTLNDKKGVLFAQNERPRGQLEDFSAGPYYGY